MSKIPLKQLSVNTFESQRLTNSPNKKSTTNIDRSIIKKKSTCSKQIEDKRVDISALIQQSTRMTTNEFETFVQNNASDAYWHVMAEFYRNKLEDTTRENQQLHDIVDQLNKDNDNLRTVANHCEYLTDLIEKLTGDDRTESDKSSSVCVRLF